MGLLVCCEKSKLKGTADVVLNLVSIIDKHKTMQAIRLCVYLCVCVCLCVDAKLTGYL